MTTMKSIILLVRLDAVVSIIIIVIVTSITSIIVIIILVRLGQHLSNKPSKATCPKELQDQRLGMAPNACRWMGFSWEGAEPWQLSMFPVRVGVKDVGSSGVRHSCWAIHWHCRGSRQSVCIRSAMLQTTFRCSTPGQRLDP